MSRLLAAIGWLAAAVVAVVIGAGAVRLIGSGVGLIGGGADVLTPQQVSSLLAAATPAPPTSGVPAPSGASGGRIPLSGPGGTVVALCVDGQAYLVNWTPAQGYAVDRAERGPGEHADVRFEGPAGRSEVRVRCANGEPTASWTD